MPELDLSHSAWRQFTKSKTRIQKLEGTPGRYRNMTYGDFKYLPRKMASEKVLRDKAFAVAINSKFNGQQFGSASMVYKFFDKKA